MILGLTGGFGCGKSSALAFFESSGWQRASADELCAEIYENAAPEFVDKLRSRWQEKVFFDDGRINKAAIAEIVFKDDTELKWLCSILHPMIAEKARKLIKNNSKDNFIFEVPLMFEYGWETIFDKTVAVYTEPELQQKRLLRKGFTLEDIRSRSAKQLPNEEKLAKADFGLINNYDLDFLKKQCKELITYIKELN